MVATTIDDWMTKNDDDDNNNNAKIRIIKANSTY